MPQTTLPEILAKIVRKMVMNGKSKIETANELGISYYQVKKHTGDITVVRRIPLEIEQRIRAEVKKGRSIRIIAEKLHVSRDSVIKYSRDIPKATKLKGKRSPEFIMQIRNNVKKYGSKIGTARKMDISYGTVRWYTKDLVTKKMSKEEIKEIRKMVMSGIPKDKIAKNLKISASTVTKYTSGIPLHLYCNPPPKKGGPHLRGRTLEILKQLLRDGYLFPKIGDNAYYHTLRKHIPSVCKVRMGSRTIIFLEDKSSIAVKAYLSSLDKKITNYQELMRVIRTFKTSVSNEDKRKYVCKKTRRI